ncbi:MAG: hypothetical protein RRC07_08025, partial [Anaerolineae bacterium]|nr:hypothetical protein [Anaerolineae bacterium]
MAQFGPSGGRGGAESAATADTMQEMTVEELRAKYGSKMEIQSEDNMLLSMGPQHPSTHGVLRLLLELDGEIVVNLAPDIGFLHTGIEKNMEAKTFTKALVMTDRMDYLAPMSNNLGYVLAIEKLLGIEVPQRTKYIRTIFDEMSRICDHLTCVAAGGLELGAFTAFLYAVEGREFIWDIIEEVTGQRLMATYARIGGVKEDITDDTAKKWRELVPHLDYL